MGGGQTLHNSFRPQFCMTHRVPCTGPRRFSSRSGSPLGQPPGGQRRRAAQYRQALGPGVGDGVEAQRSGTGRGHRRDPSRGREGGRGASEPETQAPGTCGNRGKMEIGDWPGRGRCVDLADGDADSVAGPVVASELRPQNKQVTEIWGEGEAGGCFASSLLWVVVGGNTITQNAIARNGHQP